MHPTDDSPSEPVAPGILDEISDRGFTLLNTTFRPGLLDKVTQSAQCIPRSFENVDHGIPDSGTFGLVPEWDARTVNHAAVVVQVNGNFSFMRLSGRFLADFTTLGGKPKFRDVANGEFDHPILAENISELLPRAFDSFGNVNFCSFQEFDEAARVLKRSLTHVFDCAQGAYEMALELGIEDLFSPRYIDSFIVEFPFYGPHSVVDQATQKIPVHQHDIPDETVLTVQSSNTPSVFVAGTHLDKLEAVARGQGSSIIFGSNIPHGGAPSSDPKSVVAFAAVGNARHVLLSASEKLADRTNWKPTPPHKRVPFAEIREPDLEQTAPLLDALHRGLTRLADAG